MNFGGGEVKQIDLQNAKKSREEIHREIIEKSKAFKLHAQEIKLAG